MSCPPALTERYISWHDAHELGRVRRIIDGPVVKSRHFAKDHLDAAIE